MILWGGWLLVTGAAFSFGQGIIHTYYTVALAPAIAALVAVGTQQLWARRDRVAARAVAAGAVLATGAWAYALLDRTPAWAPAVRMVVAGAAVAGAGGLLAGPALGRLGRSGRRLAAAVVIAAVLIAGLGGPTAYAADTIATAHSGSIPSAGPASGGLGGGGGGRGGAPAFTGKVPTGGRTGFPGGGFPDGGAALSGTASSGTAARGTAPTGTAARGSAARGGFGGSGGATTSRALAQALEANASKYRWVAATDGSSSAAELELATGGDPVMAIGGFSGQGGNLSLAAFEAYVAKGEIHYFIAGSSGGPGGGASSSAITSWVEAHYTATSVGGQTVYNLTTPKSG